MTSLGGYDNLCTADDAFSLCDVTVELGDCSEDPLCLKVSEQTIPECPTACCIILWNSGAGDEPTRNGMCLHKCSVSPGEHTVAYCTGSEHWIFLLKILGLQGTSSRVAGTPPVVSGTQYLEPVRYYTLGLLLCAAPVHGAHV